MRYLCSSATHTRHHIPYYSGTIALFAVVWDTMHEEQRQWEQVFNDSGFIQMPMAKYVILNVESCKLMFGLVALESWIVLFKFFYQMFSAPQFWNPWKKMVLRAADWEAEEQ